MSRLYCRRQQGLRKPTSLPASAAFSLYGGRGKEEGGTEKRE